MVDNLLSFNVSHHSVFYLCMQESEGSSLEELVSINLSLMAFSLDCSSYKILSHRRFFDCLSIITSLSSLQKCNVVLAELSEGGMLLCGFE